MEEKFFELMRSNERKQIQKLMDLNSYTSKFGLILSWDNALQIIENRNRSLRKEERIEFGGGILDKLIYTFCDSPFIFQGNYVDTLEALQEIFYLYKNESLDELSDDELLEYMKRYFDGICQGDLDYLESTCLDALCKEVREMGTNLTIQSEDNDE